MSSRTGGSTGQTGRPNPSSVSTSTQAATRRQCWPMWRDSWTSSWCLLSGRQVGTYELSPFPHNQWDWLWSPQGPLPASMIRVTRKPFGSCLEFLDLCVRCGLSISCPTVLGVGSPGVSSRLRSRKLGGPIPPETRHICFASRDQCLWCEQWWLYPPLLCQSL